MVAISGPPSVAHIPTDVTIRRSPALGMSIAAGLCLAHELTRDPALLAYGPTSHGWTRVCWFEIFRAFHYQVWRDQKA